MKKRKAKIHSSGTRKCSICSRTFPLALLNEHHVRPRAYGGSDDDSNKKWLCPTDHQSLHRLAELMLAGKSGAARSFASTLYSDPMVVELLLKLAAEAAKWEKKFEDETPFYAKEGAYKEVKISFPIDTYRRLRTLSVELGMQRSVPKMVLKLVKGVLDQRYSNPEEDEGYEHVK